MKKFLICILYCYILPFFLVLVIRMISFTCKIKFIGSENKHKSIDSKKNIVYVSWHQRIFLGILFLANKKDFAIMTSQSMDGEIVSRVAKILGWHTVRGSSSNNGDKALKKIVKLVYKGYQIGHAVDGPCGPFGVVKPGAIKIAQYTGAKIVPIIISCQNKWVFNSWDHFFVPKPFSNIFVRFGNSHMIHRYINKNEFERKRELLENEMRSLYQNTDLFFK